MAKQRTVFSIITVGLVLGGLGYLTETGIRGSGGEQGGQTKSALSGHGRGIPKSMVGVWRLKPEGFYTLNPDGSRFYPFGKDAVGRLIFTKNGFQSISLQAKATTLPQCGSGAAPCTAAQAFAISKQSDFYTATVRVEPTAEDTGTAYLTRTTGLYVNLIGAILPRQYVLNNHGQHLELSFVSTTVVGAKGFTQWDSEDTLPDSN